MPLDVDCCLPWDIYFEHKPSHATDIRIAKRITICYALWTVWGCIPIGSLIVSFLDSVCGKIVWERD